MTAPLICALPLIEGETISGYVSRTAKRHETTPRDFCSDLGMRWPLLCSGYDNQLVRLSWLTGTPVALLKAWAIKKLDIGGYKVGQTIASTGVLRRTAVRLCPQCIATALSNTGPHGAYQMLEWSLLCFYRCAHHSCPLITLPSANHSHATYDFTSRVLSHKDDILRASDVAETYPESAFETYLRHRIWHGPQDDWMQSLSLTHLDRVCLTLGAALEGITTGSLHDLSVATKQELSQYGFEALRGGPEGLISALVRLRDQSTTERPYFSADIGPFYAWLQSVCDTPALQELVSITRNHIFKTYPVPADKDVFGQMPTQEIWLTMETARCRSGFGSVYLKKLLGHMQGIPEAKALMRTDVHVDELRDAMEFKRRLMNLRQAADALAIRAEQVKALMRYGVISCIQISSALRYALRDEVDGLLAKLAATPNTAPTGSFVSLKEYCRLRGVSLASTVAAWLRGEIAEDIRLGDGKGLHALEISMQAECKIQSVQLTGDLTLLEAARYLKTSNAALKDLRDTGYLHEVQHRNPDTHHRKSYILKSSIEAFERQFVTLGQLAQHMRMTPMHLARLLDRDGITPITCSNSVARAYPRDLVMGATNDT